PPPPDGDRPCAHRRARRSLRRSHPPLPGDRVGAARGHDVPSARGHPPGALRRPGRSMLPRRLRPAFHDARTTAARRRYPRALHHGAQGSMSGGPDLPPGWWSRLAAGLGTLWLALTGVFVAFLPYLRTWTDPKTRVCYSYRFTVLIQLLSLFGLLAATL